MLTAHYQVVGISDVFIFPQKATQSHTKALLILHTEIY